MTLTYFGQGLDGFLYSDSDIITTYRTALWLSRTTICKILVFQVILQYLSYKIVYFSKKPKMDLKEEYLIHEDLDFSKPSVMDRLPYSRRRSPIMITIGKITLLLDI